MKSIFFFVLGIFILGVYSRCGHDDYLQHMYKNDPTLKRRLAMQEIELHQKRSSSIRDDDTVYTIPVVVHIIWNSTDQNIEEGLIADQIARLNFDYRRFNAQNDTVQQFKALAVDTKIQFILAPTDPSGVASSGITRTQTYIPSFPTSGQTGFDYNCQRSSLGGKDAWDTSKYMNVWVCDLNGDKLGFAQVPGGGNVTDGIVIDTTAFGFQKGDGAYNLGRTLTHEVGHWLNLKHPWGEVEGDCTEDDLVPDTPQSLNSSYQCELTKNTCDGLNMVQNYMDYSDDNCMTLFTPLQALRMRTEFLPITGRRRNNVINFNGTAPGAMGNFTSIYGPLPGYKKPSPFDDVTHGLSIDDFKSGTYLYILIACAACIGIVLLCAIFGAIRRCCCGRR